MYEWRRTEGFGFVRVSSDFMKGRWRFNFPLLFSGVANVCEWYDDAAQCFRIAVSAENRRWGKLFGYEGSFQCEWLQMKPSGVPAVDFAPARRGEG